ncbi:MAG TPA: ATP-binding protein [Gemmatimonadaceae bacterium]|nr:ATP-binding protein [Gemmatimonadaceae bacterium]
MTADTPATISVPIAALRAVPAFADLSHDELAWIAAECELVELEPGEILFAPGEAAEWMYIGVDGVLQARREQLGPGAPVFVLRPGDVGGTIPFSRMVAWAATGRAVTRARVARFPKARFPELLQRVPALTQRFVAMLIDRTRDATRREAQFEKLTALGKLSASLAHELNNPTSAVVNALGDARRRLDERGRMTAALVDAGITAETVLRLDALRSAAAPRPAARDAAEALARSDCEDALARWLAEQGVPDAWVACSTYAEAGLDDVAPIAEALAGVPASARATALRWLEAGLAAQALFASAERTAGRIAQLVDAMRRYTNRDRARDMADVDVREGIESTLALFDARFREKGIDVERRFAASLPRVRAFPGDLNQVWGILIENALDAVAARDGGARGTGHITIATYAADGAVVAEVGDDGPGIPRELEDRIFEPFFTTKDVGQGTGLSLDIARRIVVDLHGGQLSFTSRPGDTRFIVCLPLASVSTFGA